MLLLLQVVPQITNPQTTSVPRATQRPLALPTAPATSTIPGLNFESGINIGEQLGSQSESVGEIKAQVAQLKDLRERNDRPDIDGLKESRTHVEWTLSILGTVLATAFGIVWSFRRFLWRAIA